MSYPSDKNVVFITKFFEEFISRTQFLPRVRSLIGRRYVSTDYGIVV